MSVKHFYDYPGAWSKGRRLLVAALISYLLVFTIGAWTAQQLLPNPPTSLFHLTASAAPRWTAQAPKCDNKQDCFIRQFLEIARKGSEDTGWPVSLELAQWGLEHGWSMPDFDGFNLGNSKSFDTSDGVCFGYGAVEIQDGWFCDAHTAAQGLRVWEHVVALDYYKDIIPAVRSGGPEAGARALGDSPWAGSHYYKNGVNGGSLLAVMSQFHLEEYDK